ncbi:hypothetical protein [Aeoliella mucimassa]|uniref:hypothetical protein n=1 Tax=Aeoliella mucimassa TaxID=2527972 RepID=UPI00119CCAEC|nr:hypothetical protein [Aeoliella mucimassa]
MNRWFPPIRTVFSLLALAGLSSFSGCASFDMAGNPSMQSGQPMTAVQSEPGDYGEDPLTSLVRAFDRYVVDDGPPEPRPAAQPRMVPPQPLAMQGIPQLQSKVRQTNAEQLPSAEGEPTRAEEIRGPLSDRKNMPPRPTLGGEPTESDPSATMPEPLAIVDPQTAGESQAMVHPQPTIGPQACDDCMYCECSPCECNASGVPVMVLPSFSGLGCRLPSLPNVSPYFQPPLQSAPPSRFFPVPSRPVFAPRAESWASE